MSDELILRCGSCDGTALTMDLNLKQGVRFEDTEVVITITCEYCHASMRNDHMSGNRKVNVSVKS